MVESSSSFADTECLSDTALIAPAGWLRQVQVHTVPAQHITRKLSSNAAVCSWNQAEWLSLAQVLQILSV